MRPVKRRGPKINADSVMTDDVESRRRRAVFRATHRGNKEMDWLIGRFAQARLAAMSPEALTAFERLLFIPDPHLYDMIMHPEVEPAGEHAPLVAELRAFHGLE
jgi:antitoxin CptB